MTAAIQVAATRLPLSDLAIVALIAWCLVSAMGTIVSARWWVRERRRFHLYGAASRLAMIVWFSGTLIGGEWEMHWMRVVVVPIVGIVAGIAHQMGVTRSLERRFTTVYPRKDGGLDFVTSTDEETTQPVNMFVGPGARRAKLHPI